MKAYYIKDTGMICNLRAAPFSNHRPFLQTQGLHPSQCKGPCHRWGTLPRLWRGHDISAHWKYFTVFVLYKEVSKFDCNWFHSVVEYLASQMGEAKLLLSQKSQVTTIKFVCSVSFLLLHVTFLIFITFSLVQRFQKGYTRFRGRPIIT